MTYLQNKPGWSRYSPEKGRKFEFGFFSTVKKRLFWPRCLVCLPGVTPYDLVLLGGHNASLFVTKACSHPKCGFSAVLRNVSIQILATSINMGLTRWG